jgi:hypothetical protein
MFMRVLHLRGVCESLDNDELLLEEPSPEGVGGEPDVGGELDVDGPLLGGGSLELGSLLEWPSPDDSPLDESPLDDDSLDAAGVRRTTTAAIGAQRDCIAVVTTRSWRTPRNVFILGVTPLPGPNPLRNNSLFEEMTEVE